MIATQSNGTEKTIKLPVRTISISVAEVLEGGTKAEFYSDLRKTLDVSVQVANIAVTACLKQDNLTEKYPPKIYTYPDVSKLLPGLTTVASSIAREVEGTYKADRYQMKIGRRSIRSYRSMPFPLLSNKSHRAFVLKAEPEYVTARFKLLSGNWLVRLAGGSNYRDQIATLKRAIADLSYGDSHISIVKNKAVLGVSCRIPVRTPGNLSGYIDVVTQPASPGSDTLLAITTPRSDYPARINCPEVRQWASESTRRFQAMRENRKSGVDRRRIREGMNALEAKMTARKRTLCHTIAANVVGQAIRKRVATINLDFTVKSFVKSFPWYDLTQKIKDKASLAGITVVDQTKTLQEPDLSKPHVYFKYAASTHRIKIGMTARDDGSRHGSETDSSEELIILAIDNQPKAKVRDKEKSYQSQFKKYQVQLATATEWFDADPVLLMLRERGWLGNAGNLSQIAQVMDVQ